MLISFIIPAYNEENYIGNCLESVLRELEKEKIYAEIIVVNNASTDKTKEVALRYPGVRVVDEPQKGIVWARRAGLIAAQGDLIANIDADTRLTPGWIKKVAGEFSKNKNLVALSGPFIFYDLSKKMQAFVKIFYYIAFLISIIRRILRQKSAILQGGNYVVKKSALEKIGGYNTSIEFYGEDADVAIRLEPLGEVKFAFDFPIYSSGRRLAEEGVALAAWRYVLNYFWIVLFGKPFTKKSEGPRPAEKNLTRLYEKKHKWQDIVVGILILFFLIALGGAAMYLAYLAWRALFSF